MSRTVHQAVADDLREAILRGRLVGGTRLTQAVVAAGYGVSPIPVREALRQLESEGLVQSSPRRGAVVASLSRDELQDLYDIRMALESLAIRIAIPRADREDFSKLEALLARMDAERDASRWLDLNFEFHRALYAPSNRPHLRGLIDVLRRNTERYLRIAAKNIDRLQTAQVEHRRILKAYRERSADDTAIALQEHLQNTLGSLLGILGEKLDGVVRGSERRAIVESIGVKYGEGEEK